MLYQAKNKIAENDVGARGNFLTRSNPKLKINK